MVRNSPSSAVAFESSEEKSGTERKVATSIGGHYKQDRRRHGSRALASPKLSAAVLRTVPGQGDRYSLGGEMKSQAQPARKQRPPSGVIAPSQRAPVTPMMYKLPLKMTIPANKSHHAPRLVEPTSARTKRAIA